MQTLLNNIIQTSLKAGDKIMSFYSDQDFKLKKDSSPLTEADLQSNKLIYNDIKSYSKLNILSEEGSKIDWKIRKNWDEFWIVDPLDGTKEFLKKNDEFTVNIALIKNKIPVLGVIYVPAKKLLYYALKGHGSYKINIANKKTNNLKLFEKKNQIFVNDTLKPIIRVVASRSHKSNKLDKWLSKLKNYKLLDAGSSLKFCMIAEGIADFYPRFVGSSEWDIAAGYIIVQESGGAILTENNGYLKFNKKNLRNPNFIAFSKIMKEGNLNL